MKFLPTEITAKAGTITFFLDGTQINPDFTHNMNIGLELPPGVPLAVSRPIESGESAIFTVSGLEPGTYEFWCSIHEHYAAGMVGTLTVTP